jgi:hypothetical protein
MSCALVGLPMIGIGRSRKLAAISSAVGALAMVGEGDLRDRSTLFSQSAGNFPSAHCKDAVITCTLKNEHKLLSASICAILAMHSQRL